ncbi:MAG: DinB family protein [Cyclobacteriaceae bacterium]
MSRIEFIEQQTQETRLMTKKLINDVPDDLWYQTPEIVHSNIAWQVGHLIIAQMYHSVSVVTGSSKQISDVIPLKLYIPKYGMGSDPADHKDIKPSAEELREQLDFVNEVAKNELRKLDERELDKALEPTRGTHPIAKTKYEALTWSFKHEMWHCGQISTLKRILGKATSWAQNASDK